MGEIGTPSRILAGKFGAPFTYATFHHERTLAPGQLSYQQMTDIYHYDEINAETEVYGVIADPVGHSLSPLIHNAAFRQLKHEQGLRAVPRAARGPRRSSWTTARELGIKGLSVTIPHKEAVLRSCTQADGAVRGIGAANTIVFEDGANCVGYNTDYRAAMDSLDARCGVDGRDKIARRQDRPGAGRRRRGQGAWPTACKRAAPTWSIAGRTLAAGRGAGRAAGVPVRSTGTTAAHGQAPTCWSTARRSACTPTSTKRPTSSTTCGPSMVVFDTVYNPEKTLLIKEARQQGCTVVTGVEMFVRQAALQFKLFTGQEAPPP